jgi:hypothetical protein
VSCDDNIYMKKGDRLPALYYVLELAGTVLGTPDSVAFKFEPEAGGAVTSGAAAVESVSAGKVYVRYDWGAADTATAGRYRAEFVATYAGGKEITFPNGDGAAGGPQYLTLIISDDVS